jgi:serine/threonine protein kinase
VSFIGTKGYLAPEGPGSAAADIFSLGKLLYVAATGMGPENYPRLPDRVMDAADHAGMLALQKVWLRACDTDPARRHPSAAALVEEVKALFPEC